jgi:hypothetical protein
LVLQDPFRSTLSFHLGFHLCTCDRHGVGRSICNIVEETENVAVVRIAIKVGHPQTVVSKVWL